MLRVDHEQVHLNQRSCTLKSRTTLKKTKKNRTQISTQNLEEGQDLRGH